MNKLLNKNIDELLYEKEKLTGKQRLNETRSECVKREVLDETGYDVYSVKEISLRYHTQFPVGIVYHLCKLGSPKPITKLKEPWEIVEIRMVKPEKNRKIIYN